uniref:Murine leukemia virus integrase C-terminal domain-containing protein n=1 Tax=Sander lucioperca TaxID=283035 RepID=A0A8C9YD69_SANLU
MVRRDRPSLDKGFTSSFNVHEDANTLKPGDFVVVKNFRRKNWQSSRWQGPFQVLLVTHTAVKVAQRATWIHASHCRKVPDPTEGEQVLAEPTTSDEQVPAESPTTEID